MTCACQHGSKSMIFCSYSVSTTISLKTVFSCKYSKFCTCTVGGRTIKGSRLSVSFCPILLHSCEALMQRPVHRDAFWILTIKFTGPSYFQCIRTALIFLFLTHLAQMVKTLCNHKCSLLHGHCCLCNDENLYNPKIKTRVTRMIKCNTDVWLV